MSAGANQQLVATKLEETPASPETTNESDTQNDDDQTTGKGEQETAKYQDGVLEIEHSDTSGTADEEKHAPPPADLEFEEVPPDNVDAQPANDQKPDDKTDSTPGDEPGSPNISEVLSSVSTGDDGVNQAAESNTEEKQTNEAVPRTPKLVTEPPQLGGMLTANSQVEPLEPSTDPLSLPSVEAPSPLLNRPPAAPPAPHVPPEPLLTGFTPPPPAWVPPSPTDFPAATPPASPVTTQPISDDQTLTKLEETVNSPHLAGQDIDAARDEVMKALSSSMPSSPEPIEALNAQPLGGDLHSGGSQQSLATAGQDFMATLQQTIPSLPPTGGAPAPPDQASISQPTFPPEAPASYENLPGNESVPSLVVPHSDSMTPPPLQPNDAQASVTDPNAPPPVPPPIPYHFGNTPEPPKNNQ
jgi:hypothetical protein